MYITLGPGFFEGCNLILVLWREKRLIYESAVWGSWCLVFLLAKKTMEKISYDMETFPTFQGSYEFQKPKTWKVKTRLTSVMDFKYTRNVKTETRIQKGSKGGWRLWSTSHSFERWKTSLCEFSRCLMKNQIMMRILLSQLCKSWWGSLPAVTTYNLNTGENLSKPRSKTCYISPFGNMYSNQNH